MHVQNIYSNTIGSSLKNGSLKKTNIKIRKIILQYFVFFKPFMVILTVVLLKIKN